MTIGTTISAINLTANGATTAFAYPFLIPQASDVLVSYTLVGGSLTILSPTQYQITGVGNPNGGTIIYPLSGPPLAAGSSVIIARILPLIQATSVSAQGPTFAAIESALDYQMMVAQQLQQEIIDLQFEINNLPTSSTSSSVLGVGQISTVAALRAYTGTVAIPLWLVGYTSPADGGEGMFAYSSSDIASVDNGGTVIVDGTGRRWHRETGEDPYSVKWFGATGNNTTDDTAAISSCFAAAMSAVYVPFGTYRVSSGFVALNALRLFGDGNTQSVFSPSVAVSVFTSVASGSIQINNIGFAYPATAASPGVFAVVLAPSGSSATASGMSNVVITGAAAGIQAQGAPDLVLDSVFVYGFSTTAALISASTNVNMTNCGFYGSVGSTTSSAVLWIGVGGFRMTDCSVNSVVNGLLYDYGSSATTGKLVVANNGFEAVMTAITLERSNTGTLDSAVINGNAMHSCVGAISIPHDAAGAWIGSVAIVGNAYVGLGSTGDFGFEIDSASNFNISDNTLFSNTTSTIAIRLGASCSMAVVQGNNLAGSFAQSISVSPAATMIRVLDNPGYNPVGSSTLSAGASPWTYTASMSPQTLYMAAATSINSVLYGGVALLPGPTGSGAPFTLGLGPNETVVVSYSGAMTASVMTH
jgi:hypothetical protein